MATAAAHVLDIHIPTRDELVERARAMLPALKARQNEAYANRKLPADTMREMVDAGFFRILQPKRYGGFEMDPQVFFDVQMTIAEACMSTAWVLGVVGCHPYQLALFDDRAQQEVWGKNPDTLVSSSYQPVGKVEVVEGGFRLSGRWGFSSGSEYCDWVLLGSLIFNQDGGAPEMRTFLVPRKDYQILDNWHTFGLQATGSQDIVVENAFVPDYRTHKAVDGFLCQNPGQAVNDGPLYRLPWAQVFVRSVSTAAIGSTQGALNAFMDIAKKTSLDQHWQSNATRYQLDSRRGSHAIGHRRDESGAVSQLRRHDVDDARRKPAQHGTANPLPLPVLANRASLRRFDR